MLRKLASLSGISLSYFGSRRWISCCPPESSATCNPLNGQSVLLNHLKAISSVQKNFLFGNTEKNGSPDSLFDSINDTYADSMKKMQKLETDLFIEKQRNHYIERLDDEVAEFISEHSEILKEFEIHELEYFQNELSNDTKEFSDHRQKECRIRLEEDIQKYQLSIIPSQREEIEEVVVEKEENSETSGELDGLISSYINRRHNFYEQTLNDEIIEYVHKRKLFYEELIQTRLLRKAETVKSSVEKFQAKREAYYKSKLHRDAERMSNAFQGHYEKCFLQCYARYAWLHFRQRDKNNSDKIASSMISTAQLVREIPLLSILEEYERSTISDMGRDLFLKAAHRLTNSQ